MSHIEVVTQRSDGSEPSALPHNLPLGAESEQRLHDLLNLLPAGVYTIDTAGYITFYNEAAAALWGRRPQLNSSQWCGSWRMYWPDGTPLPHHECPMATVFTNQRPVGSGLEALIERPDGTRMPFMAFPSVLRDQTGQVVGAVNMFVDITDRKRNEEMAQRLAAIVESSDDAIISKDLNGTITSWNRGAERLFGYTAAEIIGGSITRLMPPDRQQEESTIIERIRQGLRVEPYDTVRLRRDGSAIDISLTVSPITDAQGRIIGASKIARDIAERKRSEERIKNLAREAEHRARNVLATVQATVHLTHAETADGLKQAIEGRIQALANVHALFVQSHWEGADLRSLVTQELSPYCRDGEDRARIDGLNLLLEPKTAQTIAVTLHELATNAAKYGALSVAGGRVQVEWADGTDAGLVLRWTETGGPAVKPPERQGFGTRVMDNMIRGQHGGTMHLDWRAEGLACEVVLPV
jgi:PAS domain S-box-containing protein